MNRPPSPDEPAGAGNEAAPAPGATSHPPRRPDPERFAGRFEVGEPLPYALPDEPRAAAVAAAPPRAVFIAHGMGQQTPFATLDQLAAGLRREDAVRRGVAESSLPTAAAREVVLGGKGGDQPGERMGRLELRLRRPGGGEQEVHLYEGYWSYLTEGKVTLRNVMGFMFRAGRSGLRQGLRVFPRWLFGKVREFPAEVRTVVYFLIGLGVVSSLVEINAVIVAVAAARAPFATPPSWLSPGLFADLTTTFNLLLAFYAVLGVAIAASVFLRALDRWIAKRRRAAEPPAPGQQPPRASVVRALRRVALRGSWLAFWLTLLATLAAGVVVPILLYLHGQCVAPEPREVTLRETAAASGQGRELVLREVAPPETPAREFWPELAGEGFVRGFNETWERILLWLAAVAAVFFLVPRLWQFVLGLSRTLHDPRQVGRTLAIVALLVIAVAVVGGVAWYFGRACGGSGWGAARSGLAWPLLIGLSGWIRTLLIQYVGDVAVYVDAHVLDRFHEVRERICNRVQRKARAVYAATAGAAGGPAYESIAVVGHSLGSVLVYDILNRMITDDLVRRAAGASGQPAGAEPPLDVAARTRMLLTFGSPLDKVAFLFGLRAGDGKLAREALDAWKQPLIRGKRFRPFRWLNVHAPADIFSGHLDYFDPPEDDPEPGEGYDLPDPVDNLEDEEALTLLAAHSEYWSGSAVFGRLHDALTT